VNAVAALLALVLCACVRTDTRTIEVSPDRIGPDALKPATNLPARFDVVAAAGTAGDCPPRLRDGELGTTLTLLRSTFRQAPDSAAAGYRAYGDYRVEPRGRYGEEPGEGLRVDCARLRAVGVVAL
jgi:hypothetical protein